MGDRQRAEVRAGGFILRGIDDHAFPDETLQAVVALNGVTGIAGAEAMDGRITVTVPKASDLMASAIRALDSLAKDQTQPAVPLRLRFFTNDTKVEVSTDLSDPAGQISILQRFDRLAKNEGLMLAPNRRDSGGLSLHTHPDGGFGCTVFFEFTNPKNLRHAADAKATLDVKWFGTGRSVFTDTTVATLQKYGPAMARIRDAGFVIVMSDRTVGDFRVDDSVDGAPVLTTPEGQDALVKAIRGSGFPGTGQFTILNKDSSGALEFAATTTSTASDVQFPSGTDH